MSKLIKYGLFTLVGIGVLFIAVILIIPFVFDVRKYKPEIAERVAAATGRPVSLGGDLSLSLFPWVGVAISDFQLGSPEGFGTKEFVKVKSFEAHVKVLPLLSKKIEVSRFVLDGPEIHLVRNKGGQANWEGLGAGQPSEKPQTEPAAPPADNQEFSLESIEIGEFSVLNGLVRIVDQAKGEVKEISGLSLVLKDVSLDRPIGITFQALVDGKPLALTGNVGPLGQAPGQGVLPIDFTIAALEQLDVRLYGTLNDMAGTGLFDLSLDISEFSPRQLLAALEIPLQTCDPQALDAVTLSLKIKGDKQRAVLDNGLLTLDGSKLQFRAEAKAFNPPNLKFAAELDALDLDRYLPPKKEPENGDALSTQQENQPQKIDYAPLRNLTLDAKFRVGKLKAQGARMENIDVVLVAENGVFQLAPFSMELYRGKMESTGTLNVQQDTPVTAMTLKTTAVQIGPLLHDFLQKDILEGVMRSDISLEMRGDAPDMIKRSLQGKGDLLFQDGAILGVDLAGMVRNVEASFGLSETAKEKPRTDFDELHAPFTISSGTVHTPAAALKSPLIRVTVAGTANLVTEALDMKVKPKFVTTLKGQGDTVQRSGLMVPVVVGGTFQAPAFSADLEGLLQSQVPDSKELKKVIEQEITSEKIVPKKQVETIKKGIKQLIPGFSFD